MNKEDKFSLIVLIFTIIYVILFGIYYFITKNYEFLWYVIILFVLIGLMVFLNKKYQFSPWVLLGTSIWGLMHMAGGSLYIHRVKLYAYMIYTIFPANVFGTDIFRYDQLAHFYFYFVITFLLYSVVKNYINKNTNKLIISLILIFIAMGIGALNEIIEFIAVIVLKDTGVGDYFNTLWDINFNTLGAIVAVIILNFKVFRKK